MEPQIPGVPMVGRITEGSPKPVTPNVAQGDEVYPPPPFPPYRGAIGAEGPASNPPRQRSYRRPGEWKW